jgi:copper chaperone CopZ
MMAVERTYVVEGMTCGHCKAAVEQEVGAVTGVNEVRVDLASGRVTVVGDGVDDDAVAAAVDEAGYSVRS